jgi:N-6 DNA Methylase
MKDADLKKRRNEGAFYTPRHLAETTLHVALEGRYTEAKQWRILDPACGSGIFLVAMFNMLAEQWRRENSTSRRQTKAQALLEILQKQIRGVDVNPDACRITAFSLYLALFEKLKPMDVDEFKEKVSQGPFLPALLWDMAEPIDPPVVLHGDFLNDKLPLEKDFDLVIGNPPWESRGKEQIALHFALRSPDFLRKGGIGCLLLPSAILVNRNGTLDGAWFRKVTVEKIVQLADFRFVLFEATHPCFILRYLKTTPTLEHTVAYETPKLNRFDRRQGVIVVEPDEQKLVPQHDVLEAALQKRLQSLWSRKFWGTPRDEGFLRRLDFYPKLSESVSKRKWGGGVGFQPFYPGVSPVDPAPLEPWKLSDKFLPNHENFPKLVLQEQDFSTLKLCLENAVHRKTNTKASLKFLRRKPENDVFTPPMVVYSKGFTKCAFCNYEGKVRFFDGLRSISGPKADADLLRFLSAVIGSRLFKYITFHSGSNSGIGRDQIHVYESMGLPFLLPDHELAVSNADDIIVEAASIFKEVERAGRVATAPKRESLVEDVTDKLEELVEAYFSVTTAERILIEDTLTLSQPSIHRPNLDADIPSLALPSFLISSLTTQPTKDGRLRNSFSVKTF